MKIINGKSLGLSLGLTGILFYVACIFIMLALGQEGTTWFFNSILHGIDVAPISRVSIPFVESLVGLALTFVLGWIAGYIIAQIYNWNSKVS